MKDIFIPDSLPSEALISPLHVVTWVTSEPDAMERALCEGYGLVGERWTEAPTDLKLYLGFEVGQNVRFCVFRKQGPGANVAVRLVHLANDVPSVRPEHLGLYLGGVTLSFPIVDLAAHERRMEALDLHSTIGIKEMDFTSPMGETYTSAEIVYKAPDYAFLMGVTRPEILVPTGPIDPDTGIGGPSYSARCARDAQGVMEFFRDVLGFEIRRDVIFEVGERSALLMPEGTRERFIQCFAPGSQTGYCVIMDHHEATRPSPAPGLGPPNRGITMWSFLTKDFDALRARIKESRTKVLRDLAERSSPALPKGLTMIIEDPDGFPIEIGTAP